MQDDVDFLVSLTLVSGSSWGSLEDSNVEVILPGVVPESHRSKSEANHLTSESTLISVTKQLSPQLYFETIKNIVDRLFDELHLKEKPAANRRKILDVIMSIYEIRKVSKELTDKIYDHHIRFPWLQWEDVSLTLSSLSSGGRWMPQSPTSLLMFDIS